MINKHKSLEFDKPEYYFKYCNNCIFFYIKNYHNIICKKCMTKCINYNLDKILYYKAHIINYDYLIGIIWKFYKFNKYYNFNNYSIFSNIMNSIFDIILENKGYQYELIFYLIHAYLLREKRKNKQELYIKNININFNYDINMLILDFYFSFIILNDYNINFTTFKNILCNNIAKPTNLIIDITMLYIFYKHYLKLLDYNINIKITLFYNIFENIINCY
jgi:hypothetical protein